jgi:hypothetical protein
MGKTPKAPGKAALGPRRRAVPPRAALAALFALIAGLLVHVGVPAPGVETGDVAPETYVARSEFTYVDFVETAKRRQDRRNKAFSVYEETTDWRTDVARTVGSLLGAVARGEDLDDARGRLRAEGIEIAPTPVWEAIRSPGGIAREDVLRPVEDLIERIASRGVISDRQFDEERDAGRKGIHRPDRPGRLKEAVLGADEGVLSVSAARRKVSQGLHAAFAEKAALAHALAQALARDLGPSLVRHEGRTRNVREAAARAVEDVKRTVSPGFVIIRKGERVEPTEYEMILRDHEAYYAGVSGWSKALRLAGTILLVGLVIGALGWTTNRIEPRTTADARAVFFAGLIDIVVVAAARTLVVTGLSPLLTPVALTGILLALAASPLFACLNAGALAVVVALASGPGLTVPVTLTVGGLVAALAAARARRRSDLLRAGALAGVAQLVAVTAVKLSGGVEELDVLLEPGGWALLSGVGSGLLSLGLLPFVETAFGVTTDISLLELSDQDQPALRRLLLEAPGSYHHSLIVGNLAEAGADAIGANALLARVASYYHDLGKVDRPEYFVENEPPGRGRHEGLTPTMSSLVITSHVRDGVALARDYGLPRAIMEVIGTHHGAGLVEFFYRTAVERSNGEPVDEQLFRYPGPKPRTREAAIVLLADTVEAASRTLEDPSPAQLAKLVRDLTMRKLLDGQLDDSGLTLRELRIVSDSFVKVLTGMFHTRLAYPSAPGGAEGAGGAGRAR